jgi:hypothetical protein
MHFIKNINYKKLSISDIPRDAQTPLNIVGGWGGGIYHDKKIKIVMRFINYDV